MSVLWAIHRVISTSDPSQMANLINLPPQSVIGPQHEQRPLPYENVNTYHDVGGGTFVMPYPVSYGEFSRLFFAVCEADHGKGNEDAAQEMLQETWTMELSERFLYTRSYYLHRDQKL
jgi:hypothetical protein